MEYAIEEIKELRKENNARFDAAAPDIVDTLLRRVAVLEEFAEKSLMEFYECASAYWDTQEELEDAMSQITGEPSVKINNRLFNKLGKNRRARNYQVKRNGLKVANADLEKRVAMLEAAIDALVCPNGGTMLVRGFHDSSTLPANVAKEEPCTCGICKAKAARAKEGEA